MKLKELENVIFDDATISIQMKNSNELPIIYNTWRECKKELKKDAWEKEVKLNSYCGIQIVFD